MDLSFETELANDTAFESNQNVNSSLIQESSIHKMGEIQSIGLSQLFKDSSANSRNCVIAYAVMFIIGAPGNLYVVFSVGYELWKKRFKRSSRIKLLIWHLALADLFVTFVVIPVEIFWRLTFKWYGGNGICKSLHFVRTFGIYLSSMIIICISMERFCAIVFPLRSLIGMRRTRKMLFAAWTFAIIFASPQIVIFSAQKDPLDPSFRVCTNSHYFPTFNTEILYNLLSLVVLYFAPLIVIIVTYTLVFFTISSKSREQRRANLDHSMNHLRRHGNVSQITRAKNKTKWISMVIVTGFVICWTLFAVMQLWYMFDRKTAKRLIDPRLREALFVTAVSNSCLNPIIYGNYMRRFFKCICLCGYPKTPREYTITLPSLATPAASLRVNFMKSSACIEVSRRSIAGKSHPV